MSLRPEQVVVVPVRGAMKHLTLKVKVTGLRRWRVRVTVAGWLIHLAGWLVGCKVEVTR